MEGRRETRVPLTLEELRQIQPNQEGKGLYYADGELYRTSIAVRRGVGNGLQLTLTIPLLDVLGGFGDSLPEPL